MNVRDPFRFRTLVAKAQTPSSRRSVRMIQNLAIESQRSRIPQMAAALSYRTVFGLLPMIIVGLVAMRFFIDDKQIDEFINRGLSYAGLEAIVLEAPVEPPPEPPVDESAFFEDKSKPAVPPPGATPAPGTPSGTPATAPSPSDDGERPLVTPDEVKRTELVGTIRSLVTHLKNIDYRAIGSIGAITLVYAAISMLIEIERCFNQMFRVLVGKPWRRRILEYWALLTLGTICLVGTFYVGERAKAFVNHAMESTGFSSSGIVGIMLSGYAITVVISTLLLLLVYLVLPNTRVRFVPALAGALLAAILWEAGKWGFTQYLRYSAGYAKFYGSIALIPLFLLWIYATWVIVLFGLQVTYHIQQARAGRYGSPQPVSWSDPPSGVVDPTAAVAILHAAARGFLAGKPVSLTALVQATRAQGTVVVNLVSRLVDANFLYRVNVADDPNNVTLARPPEQIPVRDVLELGYDLAGPTGEDGGTEQVTSELRARLRDTHLQTAGSTTIADLLTSSATTPASPPAIPHTPLPPLAPIPIPLSNKPQPETPAPSPANPYPQDSAADTLPLHLEGDPERDQESSQNGVGSGDPPRRTLRDPGVL